MDEIKFTLDELFPIITAIGKLHPITISFGLVNVVCTIHVRNNEIIAFNPNLKNTIVSAILQYRQYDLKFHI